MKKYILILAAALSLAACTKGSYDDYVGGHNQFYMSEGGTYMMRIADYMVTDALDEIELALSMNDAVAAIGKSTRYLITGPQDLTEQGSTWKVISDASNLFGLEIINKGADTWQLLFNGNYKFWEEEYPTSFTMELVRGDAGARKGHYNWTATYSGTRTEQEPYSCKFYSINSMEYKYIGSQAGWNEVYGKLSMEVIKDRQVIDICLLTFNGSPSNAQFVRGL